MQKNVKSYKAPRKKKLKYTLLKPQAKLLYLIFTS